VFGDLWSQVTYLWWLEAWLPFCLSTGAMDLYL
jgi:hypothetical protein